MRVGASGFVLLGKTRKIIRQANHCLLIDSDWNEISERKAGVPESLWHLNPEFG
jgi:hypothetical protein